MEKINATLFVPKRLYEITKAKISPSQLMEIAMQAILEVEDPEMSDYEIKSNVLRKQIATIKEQIAELESNITKLKEEKEMMENERKRLEEKLNDITTEMKYFKLQRLLSQLRSIAKVYEWRKDEIMADETAVGLIERIKEIKPDFDIERWIEMTKVI